MIKKLSICAFCLCLALFITAVSQAQNKPQPGELNNFQRKPSEFRSLPKNIVNYLEKNKYTIPKSVNSDQSIGGFRGEFAERGQEDWVVLASRDGSSSILIFWRGSTNNISEIAKTPDKNFIRAISKDNLVYFRTIGLDGVEDMVKANQELFGEKNPEIDHFGIDEATADGIEIVYYFYKGRWLILKRPNLKIPDKEKQ